MEFESNLEKLGGKNSDAENLFEKIKELRTDFIERSKQPLIRNINYDMVSPPK